MAKSGSKPISDQRGGEPWIELVCQHVSSLRFGQVQIVVHDARVVQIECTEKLRLDRPDDRAP